MNGERIFKVGLVGAGYISEFHVRALRRLPTVRIVGITDLDQARARAVAWQFNLRAAFPSLKAMASEGLDAVHVLTPPASHSEVTLQALESGCHVLVEKPLATSVEECDRIALAAKRAGKTVGVNHSLLRDPFVLKAVRIVESGALGGILTVDYFRSSDYPPYRGGPLPPQYRDGGYPFRDVGVHALYLMQAFLGEIRQVSAQFSGRQGDPNLLYDEWRALVRGARGEGQIQLSWNVRPMQNVLLVQGTRGVLRADLFSMFVTVKKTTPLPKSLERALHAFNEGRQISWQVPANVLRFARRKILPYHGLQMMVAEFYGNLAEGKPAPVTVEEARPIVEWTERVARQADAAKKEFLSRFSGEPKSKILVTGAAGFLGGYLLRRLLAQSERVRIFVRREPPAAVMNDPRVEVVLGDLGNPEAVERAVAGTQIVYHVGAATSGASHDFERGTVVGTRNVVESALKYGVRKLVYISSLAVLHASAARKGLKIREDWPLEPSPEKRGSYTQTKLEAERIVLQAVRERNLPTVVLRPGQVFGPGAPLLTPAVARRVGKRFVILGHGNLVLPLVYVEDVVEAALRAAQSDACDGRVFHLVDSAAVTQNELLGEYLCTTGQASRITRVPLAVVYALALGVEMLASLLRRPSPLSVYRVQSALAPLSFDCTAAEKELGWCPPVGVRVGLERTLAALKT